MQTSSKCTAAVLLSCLSWGAAASPVSIALSGSTPDGREMTGVVTYEHDLFTVCRFLSCITRGPALIDLVVAGDRFRFEDASGDSFAQLSEDGSYQRIDVSAPTQGVVAELTLREPGSFSGIDRWPGTWSLAAGATILAGSLTSAQPTALVLPSPVPEVPVSGLLLVGAPLLWFMHRRGQVDRGVGNATASAGGAA